MKKAFAFRYAVRAALSASLLFVSGCSTLSGVPSDVLEPKRLYPRCDGGQQVAPARDAMESRPRRGQKVPAGSWMVSDALYCHPDKATRDTIINTRMIDIDNAYTRFVVALNQERTGGKLGTQFGKLLLSAAGVLTGSETARKNLAAAAGLAEGWDASIDNAALYQQSLTALVSAMDAKRAEIRLRLYASMRLDLERYPPSAANLDLQDYLRASTLPGGLMHILDLAESDKNKQQAEVDKAVRQLDVLPDASRIVRACSTRALGEALKEKDAALRHERLLRVAASLLAENDRSQERDDAIATEIQGYIRMTGSGEDDRYMRIHRAFVDAGLYPAGDECKIGG